MRKAAYLTICAALCAACFSINTSFAAAATESSGEIAMEQKTGAVLFENNADARLPMASTTKIMTALIVAEDCDLNEVVTVPDEAVGVEGSSIYLKKDEEIDVRDLLYGLMLRSGNDSATALAIIHSGSVEDFVEEMNARAKKIGAENTNFANPSGLPDESHYTTARDLCTVTRYAMDNPIFKEVVSTKNYSGKFRSFANKNKMLYNFEGANGVKTGYTLKAGRCLVTSAVRDGMEVISVVLNSPDMYNRSAEILDKCFSEFKLNKIGEDSRFMCGKVLCKIENIKYFISKADADLHFEIKSFGNFKDVQSGDLVGELKIYDENSLILSEKLFSI